MNRKLCRHCNKSKPINEFGPRKKSADGLQIWCKICITKSNALCNNQLWAKEGFESATDHFNAALEHYAKVFNCPALLKHKKD